nr:hypothetical protein [Tanacetum cinerariifolium]
MLIVVPFHNLEICDSDDPPLGVYTESRFPVNIDQIDKISKTPNSLGPIFKWYPELTMSGREEFCLVSSLKFGVENSTDYNKAKDPIPFRRRVFSSDLDERPIRGKDGLLLIESILQLVLLGVDDRRLVPNRILRGYQQMKEKNADMYEKMTRFMEDMRRVLEANTTPIIADQHFGVRDISGFQSYQPGTSNRQNPMTSRRQDAGILDLVGYRLFSDEPSVIKEML